MIFKEQRILKSVEKYNYGRIGYFWPTRKSFLIIIKYLSINVYNPNIKFNNSSSNTIQRKFPKVLNHNIHCFDIGQLKRSTTSGFNLSNM